MAKKRKYECMWFKKLEEELGNERRKFEVAERKERRVFDWVRRSKPLPLQLSGDAYLWLGSRRKERPCRDDPSSLSVGTLKLFKEKKPLFLMQSLFALYSDIRKKFERRTPPSCWIGHHPLALKHKPRKKKPRHASLTLFFFRQKSFLCSLLLLFTTTKTTQV